MLTNNTVTVSIHKTVQAHSTNGQAIYSASIIQQLLQLGERPFTF